MTSLDREALVGEWERLTSSGFIALALGRWHDAEERWRQAFDELQAAKPSDARLAASANNLGVAYSLERKWPEAALQFEKACVLWTKVLAGIPALDVPIVGRSSAFHLRLAGCHQDAFAAQRRHRCVALCNAASAITFLNAKLVRGASGQTSPPSSDTSKLASAIIEAFGPRSIEIKLLEIEPRSHSEAAALYEGKAERAFVLRARSMAAALSDDYRSFEMATNLTALLCPSLMNSVTQTCSNPGDPNSR